MGLLIGCGSPEELPSQTLNDSSPQPPPLPTTEISVQQNMGGIALSWTFHDAGSTPLSCAGAGVDAVTITGLHSDAQTLYAAGLVEPCASDSQGDTTVAILQNVPLGTYTFSMSASTPDTVYSANVVLHVVTLAPKTAVIVLQGEDTSSSPPSSDPPVVVGTIVPVGCDVSDPYCYACDPADPTCSGACDPTSDPSCATAPACDPSDPSCDAPASCDPSDPSCSGSLRFHRQPVPRV
jgi:hypothetical protein